jgi:hypothetical protein
MKFTPGLSRDIANRIDSLPFRDPIKSTLAKFGVEELSWPVQVDWDINSISFRDEDKSTVFAFSSKLVSTPIRRECPGTTFGGRRRKPSHHGRVRRDPLARQFRYHLQKRSA